LAERFGLPVVIGVSAVLALVLLTGVLLRAGGGIRRVVAECAGEYGVALRA
jgi:hypothetical protein